MVGHRHTSLRCGAAGFLALVLATTGFLIAASPASAQNPVTIDVTSGPNPVANGQQLTYTIVVTNTGGAKVTELTLTDEVNGLSGVDTTNQLVLTSTHGSCGQTGNIVTCQTGVLQGFDTWTVTIRGTVNVPNGTVLNNTASVTGTKSATTFTSSDTVSTQVTAGGSPGPLPDLIATIKGPVTTQPSHDVVYTVTVDNVGTVKASDIRLTVTLPSSVTYVTSTATSLFNCSIGGTTLTCDGGAVNAGTNATVQVGVVTPAFDTTITVTTAVDPLNTIPEGNELNNASQATTQVGNVPPPDTLALEKTDASDPITPYETLTYTINLKNTSAYRADYIEIVDGTQGLDAASVKVVQADVTGTSVPLSCTVTAPKVTCTTTRFQSGATAIIRIQGLVIQAPGSVILNTATVNGNIRNKGVTNTASTITSVRPSVDLTVTQHRTSPTPPAPVRAAALFDYTITVGNSGLYNANDVLVREPLPAGVFLDAFTASATPVGTTTCAADAAQVVTCVIPRINGANDSGSIGGDTETITLTLVAPQTLPSSPVSSAIGPITSTVTVDPNNTIPENEESNNTHTTTTDVLTGVDLTVMKTDSPDPVARNGELTYTITVTNDGTQDATGIVVRDVLPTGSVFRSATDTVAGPAGEQRLHNFTCSHSNGVVDCVGGEIEGTYSGTGAPPATEATDFAVIVIDVFSPDEPGTYHNEVRVDPFGTIPEIDETDNYFLENTEVVNTHTDPPGGTVGMYKELYITDITENPAETVPYATNAVLNYDITVANAGAADAFNVVVKLTLPTGSRFRAANDAAGAGQDAFTCSEAGGVVTCSGGTIKAAGNPGSTRGIKLETFAPNDPGVALLRGIVDPDNAIGEADEANNTADETTVIQAGETNTIPGGTVQGTYTDLKVKDIVDSPEIVGTSSTLDYTVTVENHGSADAFDVALKATLPAGTVFRSADDLAPSNPSESFHCTEASGVVTCAGARVISGGARDVRIKVFAPSQPTTGADETRWAHFQATIDPDNAIPEGHEGNNTAEEFTKVEIDGAGGYTDLVITKDATIAAADSAGAGVVQPGRLITYTLEVSNEGTDDAFNVVVRDPLPSGVTFVSASASTGSNFICQESNLVVDCTGGYIQGQDSSTMTTPPSRTITIRVNAPLEHNRIVTNQAFVDPLNAIPEQSEVNNTASKENTVKSIVDLSATMQTTSISQNTEGDWTFTITKTGSGEARDVEVIANYSPGVVNLNVASAPAGWTCTASENPINQVRCVGDVTSNSLDFTVRVFKTADEQVDSYVEVDPTTSGYGAVVESDENNNRGSGTA
jgi:uncharacterized repeat protein (TIGR01451 family)